MKRHLSNRRKGVALTIVLMFVVLLAGVVMVCLAQTGVERQLAHNSLQQIMADEMARSGLSIIIGDLKQEIANGSTSTTINSTTIYTPTNANNILPQRNGVAVSSSDLIPNLIRRSVREDPITSPGIGSRASALSSAPVDVMANKGEISLTRWNKHYLIPRPSGLDPNDTTPIPTFIAPDWVFVSNQGPIILDSPFATVIGRYAYAVYDAGGLLDANVAGFPLPPATVTQFGPKGFLSFADLTVAGLSATAVTDLVGWRNYASTQPGGSFGNFSFNTVSATRYVDSVISNRNGFLKAADAVWNGRTDQIFASRQMLIAYRVSTGFSAPALQHLGTFSRDRNLPTWIPAAIKRVTADFIRSDGTTARAGEPLFRRFPLIKLSWIGSNGPVPPSRAPDVQRDFGLTWNTDHWDYRGGGNSLLDSIPAIDGTRDPDFFQYLDFARKEMGLHPTISEILSLGASIIDQYDSGPNDPPTVIEYAGPAAPSPAPPNPRVYGRETTEPTPVPNPTPLILNREFRNPGELGYANKDSTNTLDFYTNGTLDSVLLDLFSTSSEELRAGVINLNTRNSTTLAAMIAATLHNEGSTTVVSTANARNAAADITAATNANTGLPVLGRHELSRLTAAVRTSATGTGEEARELISRSLTEVATTRTWNLMIDVIAQSGRFPSTATTLSQFVVEGEKRYWLHVAIDRFTGDVIDQQLEAVYE